MPEMYADVAVALAVPHLYTYRVPEEFRAEIAVGKRALIPFGRKYQTGYVVRLADSAEREELKDLLDVLDAAPILTEPILRLTKWIAEYYFCAWGMAIKAALPAGIETVHAVTIRLNADGLAQPQTALFEDDLPSVAGKTQRAILKTLREHAALSLQDLQKKIGKKSLHSALHLLEQRGLICVEESAKAGKTGAKSMQHVVLAEPQAQHADLPRLEQRAPKQAAVLKILQEFFPNDLPVAELEHLVKFDPRSAVNALAEKGFAQVYMKEIRRKPMGYFAYQKTSHLPLTPQQQDALDHIKAAIDGENFAPILLHGVTGSGKTEVYMQAIAYLLSKGRRAIVLVPEISLTPLLVSRFLSRFEENIAVLHSGLSSGERYDEWQHIRRGAADVVIGARSAIFAPMERLGLIVVDEEHEASYKQDTDPRYHGRDTAIMRARFENIPVILGSATPSLESYYNAQQHKYHLLAMTQRVDNRPLPAVEIIDRRRGPRAQLFANPLEEALRDTLAKGEQALIFLNLRGYANFYLCRECGFVYECPRCNVTLTYHAALRRLVCHYCDFSRIPPTSCEQCGSMDVQYRGLGTERVEEELRLLFPDAAIARMDRDAVSGKNAHFTILQRFENGEIDILIGTQMIAKGHDFHNVTLVGVIAAETGLHLPDFRAGERTFQLLTQVAGRTGRGDLGGEVIIQTFTPTHYAILAAQHHDYLAFYDREIAFRQQLRYPPFSRMVNIVLQGADEDFTRELAAQMAAMLNAAPQGPQRVTVLGPSPAPLTKIRSKYRFQLLLKCDHSAYMRNFVKAQLERFRDMVAVKDAQIIVDVDPVHLL